jgi:hypothetical protein
MVKRCKMPEHNSDPQMFLNEVTIVFKQTDTCCTKVYNAHGLFDFSFGSQCCMMSDFLQINLGVERSVSHVLECAQEFPNITKSVFFYNFLIFYLSSEYFFTWVFTGRRC